MENYKELRFGEEAKSSIRNGINIVADAVKSTLGPNGKTVIIQQPTGPLITKDGVTVAKEIQLSEPFENLGAQLIKSAAVKTLNSVGDGPLSSTTLVLTKDGEKPISLLKKGELISNGKGDTQRVLQVFNKGLMRVYKIIFDDGTIVKCSGSHVWPCNKHELCTTYYLHSNIKKAKQHIYDSRNDEKIGIKTIQKTSYYEEMYCISVSGRGGIFYLKGNIPTHNTTTSTVLTQALINRGYDLLDKGYTHVQIKNIIDTTAKNVIEYVKNNSIKIAGNQDMIKSVASISANNDRELGALIAKACEIIGTEGVITVEESKNNKTTVEAVRGMQFARGLLAPHFATDYVKNEAVLHEPLIMITEQMVSSMSQITHILEAALSKNRSILLIAQEYDSEVIENLKSNKMQGLLKVVPVNAPSFGTYRNDILLDIAVLTGGKCLTYDDNKKVNSITFDMLGECSKAIITKDTVTLIGGIGSDDEIQNQVQKIKNERSDEDSDIMADHRNNRIAKLTGGVATIFVGGATEVEMKERKDRLDDAVAATRAAIEEGVIVGGGNSLLHATSEADIFESAFSSPFVQILTNCGLSKETIEDLIYKVKNSNPNYGFDIKNNKVDNIFKSGIVDPVKVVRLSIENAASIASMVLTTDCVIAPEPTKYPFNGM